MMSAASCPFTALSKPPMAPTMRATASTDQITIFMPGNGIRPAPALRAWGQHPVPKAVVRFFRRISPADRLSAMLERTRTSDRVLAQFGAAEYDQAQGPQ